MTEWDSEKDSERVNKNDGWVIENRNKRGASEWEKDSERENKRSGWEIERGMTQSKEKISCWANFNPTTFPTPCDG